MSEMRRSTTFDSPGCSAVESALSSPRAAGYLAVVLLLVVVSA